MRFMFMLVLLAGVACHGDPKEPQPCEQVVELKAAALEGINPGDDGGPLPVVLRLYQLKDRATFDNSDFQMLWQEDAQVLGPDLLERGEWTLFPGMRDTRRVIRKGDAAFLAVVALFRRPQGHTWHQVLVLPDPGTSQKLCNEAHENNNKSVIAGRYYLQVDGSVLREIKPLYKR